jgi:hypothetical protein
MNIIGLLTMVFSYVIIVVGLAKFIFLDKSEGQYRMYFIFPLIIFTVGFCLMLETLMEQEQPKEEYEQVTETFYRKIE